jgi:hypothetical protein
MTFLRDQYASQSSGRTNRRLLDSQNPYVGGIFPVDPSRGVNNLLIGASALGVIGDTIEGTVAGKSGNKAAALNAAMSSIKGLSRIFALSSTAQTSVKPTPILFQFFPESITDSRENNVETTTLPGYSLPVPTFAGSSGRTISMSLTFAQERWKGTGKRLTDWDKYNFDVGLAVQALRMLTYPIGIFKDAIVDVGITPIPFALSLPNTMIGIDKDYVFCFMRSYSVDYMSFFPDGQPRLAKMSLVMDELLVDLSDNVTGNSFAAKSDAYAAGARQAIIESDRDLEAGYTRTLNVAINRFDNNPGLQK